MNLNTLPIIGICGHSGSGKTTLIEQIVIELRGCGLNIAVAKQTPKALALDCSGKDSTRFFDLGVDVFMTGGNASFLRKQPEPDVDFNSNLLKLACDYDLVLVEGYKHTSIPKIWLLSEKESASANDAEGEVLAVLPRGEGRLSEVIPLIDEFLKGRCLVGPVIGCILIGGKSSRMGRPKHLLRKDGKSWLQRTIDVLEKCVDRMVVVGEGDLDGCKLPRLCDVVGTSGPLAGVLAAIRWQPGASFLVCSCDLPDLSVAAIKWLMSQRKPGVWAYIPKIDNHLNPLFALYDSRAGRVFEAMASHGISRMSEIATHCKSSVLRPPGHLNYAWRNVNYPEQIVDKDTDSP